MIALALALATAVAAQAGDNLKINGYTYAFPYPSDATREDWTYVPGGSWAQDPDAVEALPVVLDNPPFFSRYVEGSDDNKALAFFNPSNEPVSLSRFTVRIIWSGGATLGNHGSTVSFPDTAVIAPMSSFVVASPNAVDELKDGADFLTSLMFNGNDAIQLYKGDDLVDTIGDLSGNPGDGWTIGDLDDATADHTLVRKASVLRGNRSWPASSGTAPDSESEWDILDVDSFDNLDAHVIDVPQTTPAGPDVLQMTGPTSRLRLEAQFTLPTAGTYEIWGRVRVSSDAIISDLVLTLFGLSSTGAETFYSTERQNELPRDQWHEFEIGRVNATQASLAHYVLTPRTMFANTTLYSGYMIDYLRVNLVSSQNPPSLTILSPFASQDIPSSTVDVEFAVAGFDFPAQGYVYYELDGSPSPVVDLEIETTTFSLYQLAPGNHALKVYLFDVAANRVVASASRFFSVRLPPPSVSRVLAVAEEFTSIDLRWESDVANAITSYDVEYRIQNDDGSYGDWIELYSGPDTEVLATDLLPATVYHFAVRATNSIGISDWAAASFRTRGAVRMNGEHMSPARRAQLVRAFRGLNQKGIYQQFTHIHMRAFGVPLDRKANIAHAGPTFIHWHRQFLIDIEQALQREVNDPTLGIPYWAWHDYADLTTPRSETSVFDNDLMGGDGDVTAETDWNGALLKQGPFRNCGPADEDPDCVPWQIIQDFDREIIPADEGLRRMFDNEANSAFPTRQSLADLIAATNTFDEYPRNGGIRPAIESFHNAGHRFIGGSMLSGTSPNDPSFYLNHVEADRLYAMFQAAKPDVPYETPGARYPAGAGFDDFLWPWDGVEYNRRVSPRMVENYFELGYRYVETWDPAWEVKPEVGDVTNVALENLDFAAGLDGWTAVDTTIDGETGRAIIGDAIFQASDDVLTADRLYTLKATMDESPTAFEVALVVGDDIESYTELSHFQGTLPSTEVTVDFTVRSSHRLLGQRVGILVRSLDDDIVSLQSVELTSEVIPEDAGLSSSLAAAPINVEVIIRSGPSSPDEIDTIGDDGPNPNRDGNNSEGGPHSSNTGLVIGLSILAVVGTFGGAAGGFLFAKRRGSTPRADDYHAQL